MALAARFQPSYQRPRLGARTYATGPPQEPEGECACRTPAEHSSALARGHQPRRWPAARRAASPGLRDQEVLPVGSVASAAESVGRDGGDKVTNTAVSSVPSIKEWDSMR